MIGKTVQKGVRLSPKKGRLIIPKVKGKKVNEAMMILDYLPQKAARIMKKCIHTAASNYIDKAGDIQLKEEDLYVKTIKIDQGPSLKRWRPKAFGMASAIRKSTSHITVEVDKVEEK
ncbi:50S ribosomal protein L22 [candidate division WOR-3 bacterium]|nr:50S ribosomal protein L22 [candidate division WOR-3 bacterium]MCK4526822.1 50S ribosomal protein L22 [candidate division WOR-3 bacterium]